MEFDRTAVDPAPMGGVPCIRGPRIPVATVVDMVADGMTAAQIVHACPDLDDAGVREALRFAAEASVDVNCRSCLLDEVARRQRAVADRCRTSLCRWT